MKIDHASLSPISGPLTASSLFGLSGEPLPSNASQVRALRLLAGMARLEALHTEMMFKLAVLADEGEPDADLESTGDDEPSLCGTGMGNLAAYSSGDFEEQCEDEGANIGDDEPSLCGLTFGHGNEDDREHDACDDEPWLCGVTADHATGGFMTTAGGAIMASHDLEDACEDEGHDSDREPEVY